MRHCPCESGSAHSRACFRAAHRSSSDRAAVNAKTLYAKEMIIAMSPVPAAATGPVHHTCDMHTTMSPIDDTIVNMAAQPRARLGCAGTFHASKTA